jgi:hypothetical protein
VEKPEGERPLLRPKRKLVDNIKMDIKEIGEAGMDCMDLAQARNQWRVLISTVMNFRVP